MARVRALTIAEQRPLTADLVWTALRSAEPIYDVRPGQYLLLNTNEPGGTLRMLPRVGFIAASEPALGQLALVYAPDEPGRAWLARQPVGASVAAHGIYGRPFVLDPRARTLVLAGIGQGSAALLALARLAQQQRRAVTIILAAASAALLPPPFLLPADIEYHTVIGDAADLVAALVPVLPWADQLCAALPPAAVPVLREVVARQRVRGNTDFASVLLDVPIACGAGYCGTCALALRRETRLLCVDGPVVALREV